MSQTVTRHDDSASSSLLVRVKASDAAAWQRFVALYSPWVYGIARRAGLDMTDAADVSQEVFLVAAIRIDTLRRDEPGQSVGKWLGRITRHKIGDWLRTKQTLPTAFGGGHSVVEDAADDVLTEPAEDDDPALIRRAFELIRTDFGDSTWLCFRRMVLEGHAAATIADDLGLTPKAVRQAKYRVLYRLREEFDGLIDLTGSESLSRGADPILEAIDPDPS